MKKRIIAFLCALVCAFPLFGACGCNSLEPLSFSTAFIGENSAELTPGYKEKLVYKVEYRNDANYFKKDETITDEILSMQFTDGAYVSELEVLTGKPDDVLSDINAGSSTVFYKLTTSFSINVSYKTADDKIERTDSISTVCYFYSGALAPLYSETKSSCTYVSVGKNNAKLSVIDSVGQVFYNEKKYKVVTDYVYYNSDKDNDEQRPKLDGSNLKEKEYDYESKTLIDNAELLFALRNVAVDEEKTVYIPTVATNYGDYKSLAITNKAENEQEITVKVNGSEKTERIKVKNLSYAINSKNGAGTSQKVVIQKSDKSSAIPDKALMIEYAEPLITQSSPSKLGALVYTLTEAYYG